MDRVFSRAALFAVALMAATAGLGLWLGDLHGQTAPAVLRWGTVHRLSGVLAALMVVLVNSMAVTYFIGTGRWCREVVETYGLDGSYIERSRRLKRSAFPFALMGMLAVVTIVALGGAADPASGRPGTQQWVTPHLLGGIVPSATDPSAARTDRGGDGGGPRVAPSPRSRRRLSCFGRSRPHWCAGCGHPLSRLSPAV
jgi:hypothetical protein